MDMDMYDWIGMGCVALLFIMFLSCIRLPTDPSSPRNLPKGMVVEKDLTNGWYIGYIKIDGKKYSFLYKEIVGIAGISLDNEEKTG